MDPNPCPATYADAEASALSGAKRPTGIFKTCTYPEGTCSVREMLGCGGAHVAPFWRCQPAKRPKRTDGCSETTPAVGSACSAPGRRCAYEDCSQVVCKQGKWQNEPIMVP
ncbi:MAG: hypothetical protein U0271_31585 [Polyangiaceae bacterium]